VRRGVTLTTMACCAGIAVASLASPVAASTSGDWSMFHGDPLHRGVSPDTTIGASTAAQLATRWSTSLGGAPVIASPMVVYNTTLAENLVYEVTLGGSTPNSGVAAAVNARTGAVVWTQSVGIGIVGSPAVDGNTLYIGDDEGALKALNATTGAVQCTFQLPIIAPETAPGRIEDSPVVGHDATGPIVYFGDTGQQESINHGREWAMYGVGSSAPGGACSEKWRHDLSKAGSKHIGSWSPPALVTDSTSRHLLVFGTGQPDDAVYALDASSGSQVWRFQTLKNFSDADVGAGPTISPPGANGFADGVVYIDGKDKIEYAIDLLTGAQIWQFNLGTDAAKSTNSVSTAALVGNDLVVAYSKYVYELNATTGVRIWRSPITSGNFLGSVIVSGGTGDQVVLSADLSGKVYAHKLSDGSLVQKVTVAKTRFDASVAISDGVAYIAGENGFVYALATAPLG
jgi:outer membrane protein assembly factor BamB